MDELTIDMLPIEQAGPIWWQEEGDDLSHLEWKMADKFINYSDQIKKQREKFEEMKKVTDYQTMLKQAGYYKGKIDGIWGRLTENAYEQYSRDSKGDGHQTVVKSGDTLSKIANRYGVSVQQIAAINPQITNINRIQVGQVINLPYFIKTSTGNSKPPSKSNASTGDIAYENPARPLPEAVVTVKRSNSSKPSQTQAKPIQASNSEYVLYEDFPIGPVARDWVDIRISDPSYSPYKRSKNAFTFKGTTNKMRWGQNNVAWDKITPESPMALKYDWEKPYYISYDILY